MSGNKTKELTPDELVEKYSAMIYRLAYTRLQSVHDAEDITQEVLLKYIRADKSFNDEEHRKMWLIRVTVNTVKSWAVSAWKRHTVPLEYADSVSYTEKEASGVSEAVKTLPEKYRIPIHLFYYEGFSIKEIAKALSAAEGTIKSLLSRGREKLKEILKEESYV
ncbi:MAG: RNA polymerase sigma factor [Butyrivibrio sp.]|nr:RNA polymerase sigma factor [Butyrivibrio sp.]